MAKAHLSESKLIGVLKLQKFICTTDENSVIVLAVADLFSRAQAQQKQVLGEVKNSKAI